MQIPRPDRNLVITVLLAGLLLILGGSWFLDNFDYDYREERGDVSPEARRNRWLAAERFLQQLGLEAEGRSGREFLLNPPSRPGVLLIHRLGVELSAEAEQRLMDWIGSGGHLILTPEEGDNEEKGNLLLDHFQVWAEPREPNLEEGEDAASGPPELSMADGSGPLRIAFDRSRALRYGGVEPDWLGAGEDGALHLLQFRYGLGRLTALSDDGFLDNSEIGDHDHALLLARLVGDQGPVWLLYSSNMPSLARILWRSAPWLLLAAAALLLFWGWNQWLRLGPLLPRSGQERRNLLEHLDAAADYAWRIDRGRGMVTRSREEINQGWRRRHPLLERLDPKGRASWIAEHTGISEARVFEALYGEVADERGFIRDTLVQQRLAEALEAGGKRQSGGG